MSAPAGRGRRVVLIGAAGVLSAIVVVASCGREGGGRQPAPAGGGVGTHPAEASVPVSPDRGGGTGPSSEEGIVPVGYAHTEAGAAAAATAYLATLQRLVFSDNVLRETALRRMAAASAPSVVEGGLAALQAVDRLLGAAREKNPDARAFLSEIPIAYRVQRGPDDAARQVDVWSLAVFAVEGRTEATEVWSTNSVGLIWEAGDWRVAWWVRASGPVPAAAREAPTPSDEVLRAVAGWKGFRHAPES